MLLQDHSQLVPHPIGSPLADKQGPNEEEKFI